MYIHISFVCTDFATSKIRHENTLVNESRHKCDWVVSHVLLSDNIIKISSAARSHMRNLVQKIYMCDVYACTCVITHVCVHICVYVQRCVSQTAKSAEQ